MKCKRCNGELAHDKKRDCLYCPVCHPLNKNVPSPLAEKKQLLDLTTNEKRVAEMLVENESRIREIVRDELENWHIQKPPVTKDEIKIAVEEETWREQAKRLGIELYHRKKEDVLADIAEKTKSPERDNNDRSQEQV